MSQQTHYSILGLQPDASPSDIRSAFKSACLKTHPDRLPQNCSAEQRQLYTAQFHACVTAANCLLDPQARARYDAFALGVQMIDITGRVSETVALLEEDSEFEAAEDNPCLYTRECRCGGTYSVVLSMDAVENLQQQKEQHGDSTSKRRYATCDTCSLVLEVLTPA